MKLVGRDRELAIAARAAEDVRLGSGRVLCVTGEAGIGKTALLTAIARRARAEGLQVLEGRAAEHEREAPFGVVVDALDEHVATMAPRRVATLGQDLGAVLPAAAWHTGARVTAGASAAERFRYHRAVRALLELLGRERPVAVLLDDMHWADAASVELVLHLLRRPPAVAHLLLFALRPVGPLSRLLDAARSAPGSAQLTLEPLGRDASLELLAGVPERAARERVAQEARGNPLFLRELARAADRPGGALPRTVLAAVGLELSTLPHGSRTLIEGAAVAGDPFDPELAAAAAGLAPDIAGLDRLVAADLVRATGDGRSFAFRHPLVRRAVYDASPPAWRLAAHERAAAALERRGAGPTARAYHVARFARAGDERAIAVLTEAAEDAAARSPATAAHWYAAALALLPHADAARRARLLAPMALAQVSAGRLPDAHAALVGALELLGPGSSAHDLVIACARVETQMARHGAARRRLLAAFETAPREGRAGLAFELAAAAMALGRTRELREWAGHAARAAADTDPVLLAGAEALGGLGAFWAADADRAAAALDRAAARLSGLDDAVLADRLVVLLHLARAHQRLGRFGDAAATTARALAISRQTQRGELVSWLLVVRALALWQLLDLDAALDVIDAAEESARLQTVPHLLQLTLWVRSLIQHDHGATADAARAAQESAGLLRTLEPSDWTRIAACALAMTHVDQDPERCIREMVGAAGPQLELVDPSWSSSALLVLVRAAVAAGRVEDADRWAAEAATRTAKHRLPVSTARASCARAEVLLARGEPAAAAALAEQAAAAAELIPAPLDAAVAMLLAGRALGAAGDTENAKTALQRVAADTGRGGALRLRDAAGRDLRRLGARISAQSRRGARHDPLTERERHVAELVARGRSNKQVAATLYLSEKTVANTLTRVYAKLGVRSRTQLALTLTREDVPSFGLTS